MTYTTEFAPRCTCTCTSNGFIQRIITRTCTTRQLFKSEAEDENNDDDDDKEHSADDRQDDNKLVVTVSR